MSACLHVCVCATHRPDALGGQKRALHPLALELQRVVSHHVGARNRVRVLNKSNKCSYVLSGLSSPGHHKYTFLKRDEQTPFTMLC